MAGSQVTTLRCKPLSSEQSSERLSQNMSVFHKESCQKFLPWLLLFLTLSPEERPERRLHLINDSITPSLGCPGFSWISVLYFVTFTGNMKVSTSTVEALFSNIALTGQRIAMVDIVLLVFPASNISPLKHFRSISYLSTKLPPTLFLCNFATPRFSFV